MRVALILVSIAAMWQTANLSRADYLFHLDTPATVGRAIQLEPDAWPYYLRLAQFDRDNEPALVQKAIDLNPYDAQAYIERALDFEARGKIAEAERTLIEAFRVDHTYVPRWTLANFYLRQNNLPEFWKWARLAGQMPADDMTPMFDLCWHVETDANKVADQVVGNNADSLRQFLRFLNRKHETGQAAAGAARLLRIGDPATDTPLLFDVANALVDEGDAPGSARLWHLMQEARWIVEDGQAVTNPRFARAPVAARLDWKLFEVEGLRSWWGPAGLQTDFSGKEPEECLLVDQAVVLAAGSYKLEYAYRTEGIALGTGLRWQVVGAKPADVLAETPDLSSNSLTRAAQPIHISAGPTIVHLRLLYRRELGTTRISGTSVMRSVQILGVSS